jgi:hypothetical protein
LRLGKYDDMRYRLRVDAVIDATSYADAVRGIADHFTAWADGTPSDDPSTWSAEASLTAPHFEAGGRIEIIPEDEPER